GSTIAQNASEISQVLMRAISPSVAWFQRILAGGRKIASNLFLDKHLLMLQKIKSRETCDFDNENM
uniref:hypothetical protein n=1 Tax=Desulfobulbus elongatus TaxID=53332 RepID=UPI001B800DE1